MCIKNHQIFAIHVFAYYVVMVVCLLYRRELWKGLSVQKLLNARQLPKIKKEMIAN